MSLTKPQRTFLQKAAQPGGYRAIETYAPVVRLVELGLIESDGRMQNWHKNWVATEAGKEWLSKTRTRRKKRSPA